jgi:hypothetical protein
MTGLSTTGTVAFAPQAFRSLLEAIAGRGLATISAILFDVIL